MKGYPKLLTIWAMLSLTATSTNAEPQRYTIESGHTYPSFEAPHRGLSWWRGKFNHTEGKVVVDWVAETGSVNILVDISSIDFGHDGMNERALTNQYFDADQFPQATYNGTIIFDQGQPDRVDGQLTLLGVTKPLQLKINSFKCVEERGSQTCGADAEGEFDRSIFGMTRSTDNGGGQTRLRIQVEARRD